MYLNSFYFHLCIEMYQKHSVLTAGAPPPICLLNDSLKEMAHLRMHFLGILFLIFRCSFHFLIVLFQVVSVLQTKSMIT